MTEHAKARLHARFGISATDADIAEIVHLCRNSGCLRKKMADGWHYILTWRGHRLFPILRENMGDWALVTVLDEKQAQAREEQKHRVDRGRLKRRRRKVWGKKPKEGRKPK